MTLISSSPGFATVPPNCNSRRIWVGGTALRRQRHEVKIIGRIRWRAVVVTVRDLDRLTLTAEVVILALDFISSLGAKSPTTKENRKKIQVKTAGKKTNDAKIIKIADKASNMRLVGATNRSMAVMSAAWLRSKARHQGRVGRVA